MHSRILSSAAGGWLLLAGAALICGCGNTESPEVVGRHRQAVIGGVVSPEEDNAVVMITRYREITEGGSTRCSGTLVAPNLVVTAAHCVSPLNDTLDFTCSASGTLMNGGNGDGELGTAGPPEGISVFFGMVPGSTADATGVRIFTTGTTNICRADLALLEFSPPIEGWRKPLGLETVIGPGTLTAVLGYGEADPGAVGRQRRDEVRVLDTGIPPGAFAVNEGPCYGDSGGPALSMETGAVLGVYSRITGGDCDSAVVRNTFTRLSAYKEVIETAFEAVGAEPWLEGEPEPGSAAGAAGAAGASGAAGMGGEAGVTEPPKKKDDDDSGCSIGGNQPRSSSNATAALLGLLAAALIRRRRA